MGCPVIVLLGGVAWVCVAIAVSLLIDRAARHLDGGAYLPDGVEPTRTPAREIPAAHPAGTRVPDYVPTSWEMYL